MSGLSSLASVTQSIKKSLPRTEWLPSYISIPFTIFHLVHRACFWRREVRQIYGSQRKAFTFWTGVAANYITQKTPFLGGAYTVAAHAALIGRRHLACHKQYRVFSKRWKHVKGIFHFETQHDLKVNFELVKIKGIRVFFLLDPFSEILLRHRTKQTVQIFSKVSRFAWEGLQLSHRIIEFIEAWSFDPQNGDYARNRCFNNIDAILRKLSANPEKQKKYIRESKDFIDYFLRNANIPFTTEQLILPAGEVIHKTVKVMNKGWSVWVATATKIVSVVSLPYTMTAKTVNYLKRNNKNNESQQMPFAFVN